MQLPLRGDRAVARWHQPERHGQPEAGAELAQHGLHRGRQDQVRVEEPARRQRAVRPQRLALAVQVPDDGRLGLSIRLELALERIVQRRDGGRAQRVLDDQIPFRRKKRRCSASIVVSQSCSGFISPRPLYL